MSTPPELPECVSIIVCDDVYRDERTKKLVIVGTFNVILFSALPVRHPKMNVLLSLTNGRGEFELCVSLEHADSGDTLLEVKGPMTLDNPLQITDVNIEFLGVDFAKEGKHWIEVRADGKTIAQRPIIVQGGGPR